MLEILVLLRQLTSLEYVPLLPLLIPPFVEAVECP